jgi:hypothetical protein
MQHDPIEPAGGFGPHWNHPEATAYFAGDLDQASKAELVQELHVAIDDLAAAPTVADRDEQGQRVRQLTARVEYARDLELVHERASWRIPEPAWTAHMPATSKPTWSNYLSADQERGWER